MKFYHKKNKIFWIYTRYIQDIYTRYFIFIIIITYIAKNILYKIKLVFIIMVMKTKIVISDESVFDCIYLIYIYLFYIINMIYKMNLKMNEKH